MLLMVLCFLLGVANFAMQKAILASGHPVLAQIAGGRQVLLGRAAFAAEFLVLVSVLAMVADGHAAWCLAYLGYSGVNALAAWALLRARR